MADDSLLEEVLAEARARGFLGPGPVADHLHHARAFAAAAAAARSSSGVDLGSGGGVPGLVLACELSEIRWMLLDAQRARTTFLAEAVSRLQLSDRVTVVTARAEEVGRDERHRGRYDLVVSRAFGRPAVVAECGAPLLTVGGHLVVSEPPEAVDRWPAAGLTAVGLRWETLNAGPPRLAVMVQDRPCPDRFPRRVGVPTKRPLW